MNRRAFIKRNGLWVTGAIAFPAIVRAQVMMSTRRIATPSPAATTPPSCSTSRDSFATNTTGEDAIGSSTNHQGIACSFTAGASYTLCSFALTLLKVNSPTQGWTAHVWANSAGSPGTSLSTAPSEVNASTFPSGTKNTVTFSGLSAALTNGATYWAGLLMTSGSVSGTNNANIYGGASTGFSIKAWSGAVWNAVASNSQLTFQTLS